MQSSRYRKATRALLFTVMSAFSVVIISCGGGDTSRPDGEIVGSGSGAGTGVLEDRLTTRSDAMFTMDDLVAHGYKKSKEFDTATLNGASEAWYGFFNQRDIEVWVYASHNEALSSGVPLAESVITREPGQTDPLIPVVNRYPAFAVEGNMLMLCERDLATCKSLIDQLP